MSCPDVLHVVPHEISANIVGFLKSVTDALESCSGVGEVQSVQQIT